MTLNEYGHPLIETVGEFVEWLVEYLKNNPESVELPIAVHNTATGISHPIWRLDDTNEEGLLIWVSDEYDRVDPAFRTVPDKYNIAHRANLLLKQFAQEMEKPENDSFISGISKEIGQPARVIIKRMERDK